IALRPVMTSATYARRRSWSSRSSFMGDHRPHDGLLLGGEFRPGGDDLLSESLEVSQGASPPSTPRTRAHRGRSVPYHRQSHRPWLHAWPCPWRPEHQWVRHEQRADHRRGEWLRWPWGLRERPLRLDAHHRALTRLLRSVPP